jgi:glutamyl-tRNA synthetase/nondiscriminating glutamyl-tRNA synthetase
MNKVRVRYAPSPTGLLHIGNARTAIFNYLFAKHAQGDFIIRIEDTDVKRNVAGGEQSQLRFLRWLGLEWDEGGDKGGPFGPYHQLERLDLYHEYAQILLDKGLAYKETKPGSTHYGIRFRSPKEGSYSWNDLVRGKITVPASEVEDWVMMKENGIPTYNFAVVIDDHLMEISHILRGEEHITNTPKQIQLYQAFGWETPEFGHMTIIVNEEGKKLSKRDGNVDQFISQYYEKGYLPQALFNFIALLGWSSPTNDEIMSPEEIIRQFDQKRLTKAPSYFDREKLKYINSRHLKQLSVEQLTQLVRPLCQGERIQTFLRRENWLETLVGLFQDRLSYGSQILECYREFVGSPHALTPESWDLVRIPANLELLKDFSQRLVDLKYTFDVQHLSPMLTQLQADHQMKGKDFYPPLRLALNGLNHGPALAPLIYLLGPSLAPRRVNKIIHTLEGKNL